MMDKETDNLFEEVSNNIDPNLSYVFNSSKIKFKYLKINIYIG
jgi:hypothetical protein